MKLTTNPDWIFKTFKALPDSEHIATKYAIKGLLKWLRRREPSRVLEIGPGIGTLTFAILSACENVSLTTVEMRPPIGEICKKNLHEQEGTYRLIHTGDEIGPALPWDFVVIDGGVQDERYVNNIAKGGTIFVEGYMDKKLKQIHEVHQNRKFAETNFRPMDGTKGYSIFRFEPSPVEVVRFGFNNQLNRVKSLIRRTLHLRSQPVLKAD
jgi:protein-L-isoaspartate O-methyltransferase